MADQQPIDLTAAREYRPDEPCEHRGCLSHVTHPCDGCGRIAGRYPAAPEQTSELEKMPGWPVTVGREAAPPLGEEKANG